MGNAAAIRRGGASKQAAGGAVVPEAPAAPETPRRSPEAGWTRAEATEKLQDAELSFRTLAAEQASGCSRLWTGLRDELVASGVLRDSRAPVPLGPGAERACMQVRVALAARDTEQLGEALANWESFGLAPMVESARPMLAELRREEEAEILLRCMTNCITAIDRAGFAFWYQEAMAAPGFAMPEMAEVALQALRFRERAVIAERVKQSRHAAASPRTEPEPPEPLTQLDVGAVKAELSRRKINCNSVIEKDELVQMLRSARESNKGGSGGDGPRAGHGRGVRGSPRHSAGVVPGFLGSVREGLPPQSFKAYASERDQAAPSWPSDDRRASAPAMPEGAAGPPLVRPRSARARSSSVGPVEASPVRPQSAKQRYTAAAAEAAWAGLRRGRVFTETPSTPAPSPRVRSATPRAEPEAAAPSPRPSTHSAGGRSASKESWVVNGSVSYRSNSAAPAQRGPGTPRATPRGLAGNAAGVLDPKAAARAGGSPQTPRTPRGGAAAEPTTPRSSAGPSGFQAASPQAARPKRTPLLQQNQSPPSKPSRSPTSFWQQSPPRPSQRSAAESPRPSPTKPPQMPRRPSAYEKAGVTRQQALACLGLQGSPSAEELRRAYKEAAMRWHPDRQQNHGNPEEAKERFQEVQAAFEVLKPACQAAVAGA